MNALDLAEELADFWLPVLAKRSWEVRADMLEQILGQLADDTPDPMLYRRLVAFFLATAIDRLAADEPVASQAQARIYIQSADPKHRAMALERFPEVHSRPAWRGHPRNNPLDRRAAPRHRLTAEAGIEAARTKITCRIHNISKSGALITLHLMLQPSDEVHLTLRSRDQPINGQVARVSDHGCGILFCA